MKVDYSSHKEAIEVPKIEEPQLTEIDKDISITREASPENIDRQNDEVESSQSKTQNILLNPMLGSIDDLMAETEKEIRSIKSEKIELNIDQVKKVWDEYRSIVESPSTKVTLEKVLINISENSIHVIVPSSVSKEEISQEVQLYQKLRDEFNNNELNIIIDIDRSQFPDLLDTQGAKMYSMKEKYDYLSEKNPELNNLVKKLKLKVDQE